MEKITIERTTYCLEAAMLDNVFVDKDSLWV